MYFRNNTIILYRKSVSQNVTVVIALCLLRYSSSHLIVVFNTVAFLPANLSRQKEPYNITGK